MSGQNAQSTFVSNKNIFDMKNLILLLFLSFGLQNTYAQKALKTETLKNEKTEYKYSILTTWLSFSNFGKPETNTHHYELRLAYELTPKDQIGVKFATWKLFAPLGIDLWDSALLDRDYFYPGRLRETGVGITYQRKLWKGLFATLEVMPLATKYLDDGGKVVGKGFKLYNSYHLGYHIPLFKKGRFYIEPQLHVNHWAFNSNVPSAFKIEEDRWDNFCLIEPNIYFGMKF